jgi:hypothetical protein
MLIDSKRKLKFKLQMENAMKLRTIFACTVVALVFAGSASIHGSQAQTIKPGVTEAVPRAIDEISGIKVPDSRLVRKAAQVIRDAEGDLLFQHSMRVYYWAALPGKR